jgi:Ca2+-binding EF-hand superfamily protein
LQEFLTICTNLTEEEVEIAFHKFDTSGDDKLDYREFCTMINIKKETKSSILFCGF